jgi:hypothetical protein
MLTDDELEKLNLCRGKRIRVGNLVCSLWGLTPRDARYQDACNEVAAIVNRNREIAIRVTDNELEELKVLAAKTNHRRMADYVRAAALGAPITTPPPVTIVQGGNASLDIRSATRALQGIGKNLNQLVLNLNVHQKHHVIDPETETRYRQQIERLLSELEKIEVHHHG